MVLDGKTALVTVDAADESDGFHFPPTANLFGTGCGGTRAAPVQNVDFGWLSLIFTVNEPAMICLANASTLATAEPGMRPSNS